MKDNLQSSGNIEHIPCDDIYSEEMDQSIKKLKRFREAWLCSTSSWESDLFQYADLDFYFYRFTIDRLEKGKEALLISILYRVMERYGISFKVPDDKRNAPFAFIVCEGIHRTGYRFKDFCCDEDVNDIVQTYDIVEAVIIRTSQPGKRDEWISGENEQCKRDNIKLRAISLQTFFDQYFGAEEYKSFTSHLETYLQDARDITGYKSIKFLSSMNLAARKVFEEKELAKWPYLNYTFQIIDNTKSNIQKYLYLSTERPLSESLLQTMANNFVSGKLYKAMIGSYEYAESFITSEWLYHSLYKKKGFDYTSIISGYLKSIEQLLYRIVMLNVDNNCKITMSRATSVITDATSNGIITYKPGRRNTWRVVPANDKGFKYIDLTSTQVQYMDSSIGTFEHFLRKNPHIFVDSTYSELIAEMVCCFRTESRNGYLHTHNLTDWEIVEKTRSNAIFLYYVLLGGCIIPKAKVRDLGIISEDEFTELCKKIREFTHFNLRFTFEFDNGNRVNLVYDRMNNTVEYTDGGVEHYESLLFYDIGEFSDDTYEKLDAGIREDQKVYLTRDNIPMRIFGYYRDGSRKEIMY